MLILTHDHPDPDAVASAFGLKVLLEHCFGIRSRIAYGGIIGRIENQTMVRLLDLPVNVLKPRSDFKRYKHVALVDTQPAFGNNRFPATSRADIVIDHHPVTQHPKAACSILIPEAGATSVIIAQALLRAQVPLSRRLATAMVYGIISETQDLGRDVRDADIRVYKELLARCDLKSLSLIENPQRPLSFFRALSCSLERAFLLKNLVVAHLGFVATPDLVAQTADFLLTYEGVRWALCTGRYEDRFHLSVRALRPRFHAGKLLQKVLQEKEKAGGHRSIAGGSIRLKRPIRSATWKRLERETTATLVKLLYKGRLPKPTYPFRSE